MNSSISMAGMHLSFAVGFHFKTQGMRRLNWSITRHLKMFILLSVLQFALPVRGGTTWGPWVPNNLWPGLDASVRIDPFFGKVGEKYTWAVRFRNRYNQKINFSVMLTDGDWNSFDPPPGGMGYGRISLRAGVTTDEAYWSLLRSAASIKVWIDKVRFGENDSGPYAIPDGSSGGGGGGSTGEAVGLTLQGPVSWATSGSTIRIEAARVENNRSGRTSGSLRLEIWATSTPYDGGPITGYRMGYYQFSNVLSGGSSYRDINQTVAYTAPPDGTYYTTMLLTEYSNGSWPIQDHISFPGTTTFGRGGTRPTITVQPRSQTVQVGQSITFSVTASGTSPLTYQWRVNGSVITGATGSSLTVNNVTGSQSGNKYTVTVSNSAGSVTSSAATLTVTVTTVDGASFVSETIPDNTIMGPGQKFTKSWTLSNSGTTTWITGQRGYTLNYVSGDLMNATTKSLQLAGAVLPNGQTTFSLDLVAPVKTGTYTGYWRMNSAGNVDFGPTVSVKIVVATDGATFVSETIPDNTVMMPGQEFTKSWTLRNSGTTTWVTGQHDYTLNFLSGDLMGAATKFLQLAGPVSPNSQATFSVSLTAPTSPGIYTGYWQMNSAAGIDFGPTVSVVIVVKTPAPNLPNLTPYQRPGWSDKIVISRNPNDDVAENPPIYDNQELFLDFAIINNSPNAHVTQRFQVSLYIDDQLWRQWLNSVAVPAGDTTGVVQYSIGKLTAGTHRIRLEVDSAGAIAESDEHDNSHTKTITVIARTTGQVAPISGAVQWKSESGGNGHWYKIVTGSFSWDEARLAAQKASGHLATITSQGEQDFVRGVLLPTVQTTTEQYGAWGWWIGGERPSSGGWKWVTAEPWTFTDWAPRQPDSTPGTLAWAGIISYDSIAFFGSDSLGKWDDVVAANAWLFKGYIVEFDAGVPSSTPLVLTQIEFRNGILTTTLSGISAGATVVLQASSNLRDWVPVQTYTANGPTLSINRAVNSGAEFLRAVVGGSRQTPSGPAPEVVNTRDGPIHFIGFNRDVVVEKTATGGDTSPFAQSFDVAFNWAFYEKGLGNIGSWSRGNGSQGLPVGGQFVSLLDRTTVFQLAPYTENNVLFMDQSVRTGTLTLTAPAAYSQLEILATSSVGGGTGSVTVTFVDGSTAGPFTYNAPDWFYHTGGGLSRFGRIFTGDFGAFFTEDPTGDNPNLYQTTVTLPTSSSSRRIATLSFALPGGAAVTTRTTTGIFAVSGKR